MKPALYHSFCAIAHDKAGIHIQAGKEALVSARVSKRVRALGLSSADEYLEALVADPSGEELVRFLDAITTNFTSFYREREHFVVLDRYLRSRIASGSTRLRLWSAASSSGEEPWSMAIILAEAIRQSATAIDARILATDISTKVLAQARAGVYPSDQVKPVPAESLSRWFTAEEDGSWAVGAEMRRLVLYKRLNLSITPFPMSGPLDVVFCRNVMIYFDLPVRQGLVSEIERLLAPGGLLCTGHTETLGGITHSLRRLKPSIYQKAAL